MFSKRRVDFFPSDDIVHLRACSDIIIIAMANNILHRINTRQPDVPVGKLAHICYSLAVVHKLDIVFSGMACLPAA